MKILIITAIIGVSIIALSIYSKHKETKPNASNAAIMAMPNTDTHTSTWQYVVNAATSSQEDKDKVEQEKLRKEIEVLTEEAKTYVPYVQGLQPDIYNKYQQVLQRERSQWGFDCERKGDYLALTITASEQAYETIFPGEPDYMEGNSNYRLVWKPKTKIIAVSINDAPNIRFIEGSDISLTGEKSFQYALGYGFNNNYDDVRKVVTFPDVSLPYKEKFKGIDYSINDGYYSRLNVSVAGLAVGAVDDKIIIGEGGGSIWDDMQKSRTAFSYQEKDKVLWSKLRPGITINVPYGLGKHVYQQILDAIANPKVVDK